MEEVTAEEEGILEGETHAPMISIMAEIVTRKALPEHMKEPQKPAIWHVRIAKLIFLEINQTGTAKKVIIKK